MNKLVLLSNGLSEPYITNDTIAEFTDVNVETVNRLTRTHLKRLEQFGSVGFEIRADSTHQKTWHYNEQQATLLITFMKNTEQVANFKEALVKAFYAQRTELTERRVMLERNKQTNKDLGEVIKERYPDKSFMYSTFHNLAYKLAVGMHPKQIKAEYHVTNAPDALTADQLEQIESYRTIMANMLSLGMDYKAIKQALGTVQL